MVRMADLDTELLHLRAAGTSVVLATGEGLPRIVHWGSDLGDADQEELAELCRVAVPPVTTNVPDVVVEVGVLPEAARGWMGTPGLSGHRDGAAFSPLFTVTGRSLVGTALAVHATDEATGLTLVLEVELTEHGLLRTRATVRNDGPGIYTLDALTLFLPVPQVATELLDLTGRHNRERSPQRHPFALGTWLREGRHGRTGADATLLLVAGTAGFRFRAGEVWGLHTAWSGNHRTLAERTPNGVALLGGGELLLPGEVRLAAGEEYASPWVVGSYGVGLDAMSARFHAHLRSVRAGRAGTAGHRQPIIANTWEAVYFEHDLDTLRALADAAARAGAEVFVLDDGWFRHRRDDSAGLGDWYVDEGVWPDGLGPLAEHVRSLGMELGLWFEPEMINPDSDLARAHPDWILSSAGRLPVPWRRQQVLDLSNPTAWAYVLERMSSIVAEYGITYVKWDHNRDLVDAGLPTGAAGVRAQTLAFYALVDALRAACPGLRIESCSSGGARADLAVLERTDRIWASDCTDALERQAIQRWTGLLVPPELVGAHVSAPVSHSTGRALGLDLRASTALFGAMGIEWDLTAASPDDIERLAAWIALYRRWQDVLHTGAVVRGDHPDPAVWVNGVVALDGGSALFAVTALATTVEDSPGRVALPGLTPDVRYRVTPVGPVPADVPLPPWWSHGATLSGRMLAGPGIELPALRPATAVLLEVRALP